MRNYSREYKNYYENLRHTNVEDKRSAVYNRSNFESVYGNSGKRINKKEGFFSSMINIFIYQLVVVLVMIMTVFYLKYSSSEEATESYNNIKAVMNSNVYEESGENIDIDAFSTIKKINEYIKLKINGNKINL
ncbi:hypothetical protein [Clostridium celatum]|uniref:hypothetical protein n=1 Tax=Clostridium celatum TaxID=36834 RepID=UPI00319E1DE3